MAAAPRTPGALTAPPPPPAPGRRPLVAAVGQLALRAAWSASHPGEAFAPNLPPPAERLYYAASDGWESPLYHLAPRPGGSGEPVLLAHGLGAGRRSFDLDEHGLARALQAAGFAVYCLSHRGDEGSLAPVGAAGFDFDDIVQHDVPAAIDLVRARSGASRVLWVGHALGGQLLYAHLARCGDAALAGAITLCAPVRFSPPRSHARLAAHAARLLPTGWRVPTRRVQQALAPIGGERWADRLCPDADPSLRRGLLLHAGEDLPLGLARQAATWLLSGSLCDRDDRLDYVQALEGGRLPLLAVVGGDDPLCTAEAAQPAVEALAEGDAQLHDLGEGWGHLDVLIGRRAAGELFPRLAAWLGARRAACWTDAPHPGRGAG